MSADPISKKEEEQQQQESPADADKPARRKSMQKLLQFDVFRFISPNSISPNFKFKMHSAGQYIYTKHPNNRPIS